MRTSNSKHQPTPTAGLFRGSPSTTGFHQGLFGVKLMESVAVFFGVFLMAFCLSSALAPVDNSSATDSGSGSLTMAFTSEQTIDIAVDKTSMGIEADSTDFNKMLTDSLNVTVSTNNITGYVLNMAVDSSATNGATIDGAEVATNALVNTENNKYYLPSITSSITNPTDSTFPTNSWAYSISNPSATPTNMTYSPLPEAGSSAEIKKVTELTLTEDADGNLTADDVTPVTVATKADMSVPAGAYTNKLIFTAITNFNPEYDSYTIAYDANGGTGTAIEDQTGYIGQDVILKSNTFTRDHYTFLGWSTDKNATTVTYTNGQTIEGGLTNTAKETITLYAIWTLNKHTVNVTVTSNSGASGTPTGTGQHSYGETVTLGGVSYSTTGYHGLTWSSSDVTLSSTTATNPTFTMPDKDVTITVSGTPNTYTIAYNNGGGSGTMASTPATYGQYVTLRTNTFTRTDYAFLGWSLTNGASTKTYDNSQRLLTKTITDAASKSTTNGATITLYAVWQYVDPCSVLSVGGTCTSNGVTFIKLEDNNLWTKSSQGSATWANAASKCPSGTYLPSKGLFDGLISNYGSGSGLYNATGWSGNYWSSTVYASDTAYAWNLYVGSSNSGVSGYGKSGSRNVVCVKS